MQPRDGGRTDGFRGGTPPPARRRPVPPADRFARPRVPAPPRFPALALAVLVCALALAAPLPASAQTGICGRTALVRNAILAKISGISSCALVTNAHLAAITGELDLGAQSISVLAAGDFAGLTALTSLSVESNFLTALPAGVFDELTALEELTLAYNALAALPAGVFDELTALRELDVGNNALTALPAGVFDELTALTRLILVNTKLTALPAGVFDELTALETLYLSNNSLATLPAGVFDGLTALEALTLSANSLATLPAGVFNDLTSLTYLYLAVNPGAPFAPGAVALPDDGAVVSVGGAVKLDGSESDGGPWGANVIYSWALTNPSDGVAVTFDDATSATPTVTIPALAADTELTFTLTVTGRGSTDPASTGVDPATDIAKVTITALPIVSIESDQHLQVPEDIGEVVLTVLLKPPAGSVLSVPWSTRDETTPKAKAPDDYTARQETLTFAAGETRKTISVPIVDDEVREDRVDGAHEYFYVAIESGPDYTLGPGAFVIVEIIDNDGDAPPDVTPPTLTRAAVNGTTLVLTYNETLDGTSTPAPGDFVVTAAGSPITVNRVSVGGSAVTLTLATAVEANQTVRLDYTPRANPTQDLAGNDAAPLSGQGVTNNTSGGGGGGGGGPTATLPGMPGSLVATAGAGSVFLEWTEPPDDGGSPVTGYEYRYAAGSSVPEDTPWQSAGLSLMRTFADLANGQPYVFEVRALNGAGVGAAAVTRATPLGVPGVPESLTATAGDGEVVLEWTAPADDGGSPVTGYEYRYAAGDGVPDGTPWQDAGTELGATVTGLENETRYVLEVRARNPAGPGAAAVTRATPLGVPGVPESLTATAGDGEVVLEWTAPADDGGSPVTGYEYRYVAGDGVPDGTPWQDAGTELGATVTGLENETRYVLEVRARNPAGPGAAAVTTATPIRLEAELFSAAAIAAEGEPLVIGLRRSGGLAHAAHAYIGVTDSAVPVVGAADEGRADGLGRHRLEFATGAAEATVTVSPAFDGERGEGRVITATVESVEVEIDGVRRPYELVTPTLVVPVTEGDAGLSVADARVEGASSVLAFTVSLDRTRDVPVRVDYATEDGTARAGEDYTAVSGTLTIEAGGREARIEVAVLPALHVTGERTLTLRLSNAVSAVIDDGVATGVIVRESELPKAWLARFGRTASDHAAQAIARRLEAGQRETQVTVAGRRVDGLSVDGLLLGVLPSGGWRPASAVEDMATRLAAPALASSGAPFGGVDADPGTPGLRAGTWGGAPGALDREPFADAGQTLRRAVLPDFGYRLPGAEEALLGTSFYVERGAQQDVGGGTWAAWGDVAATRFEGDAGGLALNGDVVTGTAGLDRQWRAVLVGLALSRSSGEGGYGTGAGTIASTLTSVHPYVQVRLGERAQVWGAAGWGRGGLEITPESGAALEADLRNSMAAAGARAVLMGAGGLEIALRSDLLWTETASDGTAALAEAVGTASRGRLMLEGAGQIQGLGGVVRPKVEGGVRYDGGDAETGRGFEVGGGLDWARGSLTLQVNGRMLVAHADKSYEEWGYSGSLVYEPGADGLGLQMRVGSSAGAAASGIRNLWALENASGLVRGGAVPFAQRFAAEVGYGLGRGTLWYPYFVADDSGRMRYGLKLSSGRTMGVGLEFGRREGVDLGPQDAMLLRGELRF